MEGEKNLKLEMQAIRNGFFFLQCSVCSIEEKKRATTIKFKRGLPRGWKVQAMKLRSLG